MEKVLIAENFSVYPMGRTVDDGPDNGERFFEEFLAENLRSGVKTIVVFDGVRAFGSSFLDQVFNVIPARLGFGRERFKSLVEIQATGRAYQFYKTMAENFSTNLAR